jgi:nitrate reductase NapAB chaperone NapD
LLVNVSGILVIVPTADTDATIGALAALPGVDVHHVDRTTGRIIVTQEAATVSDEVLGLKRIKALPRVILAEMVHHNFEQTDATHSSPVRLPTNYETVESQDEACERRPFEER